MTCGVRRGGIFGFPGANGAGKTTAMRMLADLRPQLLQMAACAVVSWGCAILCYKKTN